MLMAPMNVMAMETTDEAIEMGSGLDNVEAFVARLYSEFFGRVYDQGGLDYWSGMLKRGEATGADVADNFIFSKEFSMQNNNNDEFVSRLYRTFFNRQADAGGKAYWLNLLDKGATRRSVAASFVNSTEFSMICSGYSINAGHLELTKSADINDGLTMYVYRCYVETLGRTPDEEGLEYWTSTVLSNEKSAKEVAAQVLFSEEFEMKNLSNENFIKVLYKTFMGRDFDGEGLNYWQGEMNAGHSRVSLFNSFANSKEFSMILESYGLSTDAFYLPDNGPVAPAPQPTPEPTPEPSPDQYQAGTYKVGMEMPAGEYIVFCNSNYSGYFQRAKDSSNSLNSIIANGNFTTHTIVTVADGDYFTLQRAYAMPIEKTNTSMLNLNGSGMFKVGLHIPAGEYKIAMDDNEYTILGYYAVRKDSTHSFESIISNSAFQGNEYVTVKDGQYLELSGAHIVR